MFMLLLPPHINCSRMGCFGELLLNFVSPYLSWHFALCNVVYLAAGAICATPLLCRWAQKSLWVRKTESAILYRGLCRYLKLGLATSWRLLLAVRRLRRAAICRCCSRATRLIASFSVDLACWTHRASSTRSLLPRLLPIPLHVVRCAVSCQQCWRCIRDHTRDVQNYKLCCVSICTDFRSFRETPQHPMVSVGGPAFWRW